MQTSKYSPEQIAQALRQAENGTPIVEICRKLQVMEQTFHRRKKKFGELGSRQVRCYETSTRDYGDSMTRLISYSFAPQVASALRSRGLSAARRGALASIAPCKLPIVRKAGLIGLALLTACGESAGRASTDDQFGNGTFSYSFRSSQPEDAEQLVDGERIKVYPDSIVSDFWSEASGGILKPHSLRIHCLYLRPTNATAFEARGQNCTGPGHDLSPGNNPIPWEYDPGQDTWQRPFARRLKTFRRHGSGAALLAEGDTLAALRRVRAQATHILGTLVPAAPMEPVPADSILRAEENNGNVTFEYTKNASGLIVAIRERTTVSDLGTHEVTYGYDNERLLFVGEDDGFQEPFASDRRVTWYYFDQGRPLQWITRQGVRLAIPPAAADSMRQRAERYLRAIRHLSTRKWEPWGDIRSP